MNNKINWPLIAKWRDALRSGKYKQGTMRLQQLNGSCCCLGVVENMLKTPRTIEPGESCFSFGTNELQTAGLTDATSRLFGFDGDALPGIFGKYFHLLNDSGITENYGDTITTIAPLTHNEIADLLTIALLERDMELV